jgi:hypothetical protein
LSVKKAKRTAAIASGVFGGVIGVVLMMGIVMRVWGPWKRSKPGREQAKSDRQYGPG